MTEPTEPLLCVENLHVSFGAGKRTARVLDGVNLSIRAGKIMGLIGESGCGKSTLARTVLGVLPENASVSQGAVRFQGESLLACAPDRLAKDIRGRAITFIPQDPFDALSPIFTIGDQLMELMRWKSPDRSGRERYYSSRSRRSDTGQVLSMLRDVQLPDPARLLNKYPNELSGGQLQRVMIAMALLPQPSLVIADEPTTALDVTIQAQILSMLRRLANDRGTAVMFTTHDLGAAWEICDEVTVMYAGQELECASVAPFVKAPRVPYTQLLLENMPATGKLSGGIPGELPDLVTTLHGCRFAPRCPNVSQACIRLRPEPQRVAENHTVRCHHPAEPVLTGIAMPLGQ